MGGTEGSFPVKFGGNCAEQSHPVPEYTKQWETLFDNFNKQQ
jgi:hypothetical protein